MNDKSNTIIYTVSCLMVLLLFVSQYILLGAGVIAVLLVYVAVCQKHIKMPKVCLSFIAFILINLLQTLFGGNTNFIQEIERNIIYLMIVTLLYNINVPYKSILRVWRGMLIFCFAIQVLQFFKLFNINNLLERFYGYSVFLKIAGYTSIRYFRTGSIFIAINPYFKFAAICLALFFYDSKRKDGNRILNFAFIIITLVSTLLCGSRTGFAVVAVISAIYLLSTMGTKMSAKSIAQIAISIVGIAVVFMILNRQYSILDSRLFTAEDSLGDKIKMMKQFFTTANTRELFFGMGAYDASVTGLNMDSDLGYALTYYGILGTVIYYSMLFTLVYHCNSQDRTKRMYFLMVLVIFLLGGITSGIYFNFRVFAIMLLALIPFHTSVEKMAAPVEQH